MTTVLVLQHAEKVSAPGDPGLTPLGRWQAEQAADVLRKVRPAALVCSPLLRARQTAEAVATACALDVLVDARLRERLDWSPDQDGGRFLDDWRRSTTERDWVPAQGRSSRQAGRGALSAMAEHAVQGRVVVLVSHGGVTVDLLRELMGDEVLEAQSPGLVVDGVPGAAITEIHQVQGTWRPIRIAQVGHLQPGGRTTHRAR